MKKILILAGATSLLFACNNNANDVHRNHDTSNHSTHGEAGTNAGKQEPANPITATMDKMMQEMHGAKTTGNNDVDFAAMMLAHHKGAVEMSKVEIEKGNNAELKTFAQKVIADQNKEIELMQDFISKADKTRSADAEAFQKELNGSMMAMMNDNTTIYNDIDKDFAAQMIPHHQSAVDMAKAYLAYGKESSLRKLCQNIISSQAKEIEWLKEWLAKAEK